MKNNFYLDETNRENDHEQNVMSSKSKVHLPPRFEHECSVCERKANFS